MLSTCSFVAVVQIPMPMVEIFPVLTFLALSDLVVMQACYHCFPSLSIEVFLLAAVYKYCQVTSEVSCSGHG